MTTSDIHPEDSARLASLPSDRVSFVRIGPDADGQRLDNFLVRVAKGVPKSHIYRIIRSGEVRVNKARAKADNQGNSLTLRLRELGGLIRAAGDIAVMEDAPYITGDHIRRALRRSRSVEEQIRERYGSYNKGLSKDVSSAQKERSSYYFQTEHLDDTMFN